MFGKDNECKSQKMLPFAVFQSRKLFWLFRSLKVKYIGGKSPKLYIFFFHFLALPNALNSPGQKAQIEMKPAIHAIQEMKFLVMILN